MISFKLFVEAIHHAIVSASDSLMDKNEGLKKLLNMLTKTQKSLNTSFYAFE